VSDQTGRREVYVQPFPSGGRRIPVSTEGGDEPVWSRDGRELFYRIEDRLMVVNVTTEPTFTVGPPRVLFKGQFAPQIAEGANYAVSPDGKKFLFLQPVSPEEPHTQIHVVLNWFEELKQRTAGR